jgi:ABC-type uncharacterized transport system substrate-binding protein
MFLRCCAGREIAPDQGLARMEQRLSTARRGHKDNVVKPVHGRARRRKCATALVTMGIGLAAVATTEPASAHPHVWVTMTSELVYAPDGSVSGIKQAWSFDDMYSTYATQGLESKTPGAFTREELGPLATENVTSLKEFEYFTFAKFDGRKVAFGDPVDYGAGYKDSILTLHFTLPVKTPAKAHAVELEIYDPEYFVDFGFAKTDPLVLKDAPANCQLTVKKSTDEEAAAKIQSLGEAAFMSGDNSNYGALFASKVWVKCP